VKILSENIGVSADKFHDRRLGDCLDNIHANANNIWKDIVHHAAQEYDISLGFIHYDITSLYFEGVYEDADLLDYGYSRDKKPECKQVNLRLNITDEDGIPLAFKVIKGDTADRSTPIENMKALGELLDNMPNSHDTIVITDQAMLDRDVIIQYHQQDIGYLGPLPAGKEYEQVLLSIPLSELKKHPLKYRPVNQKSEEPAIYYGVLSKVSISGKRVAGTVEPQVLILYSTNKAKLDGDKRTTLLGRYLDSLEKISRQLNQRKYKKKAYTQSQIDKAGSKYASIGHLVDIQLSGTDGELALSFKVNAMELEHDKERDGRYLLATNRPYWLP